MPFVTPLFDYLQFVYKFVCFFRQKAAIKVKDRDSGDCFDFFHGNIYLADLLYHNLFKLSTGG